MPDEPFCNSFINGHYHMWFLFMIVGLYLIVPFLLRPIVRDEKLLRYFLLLTLIFTFLLPQIASAVVSPRGSTALNSSAHGQILLSFSRSASSTLCGYYLSPQRSFP